ncbi:MAG: beta-glucosidase [Ruminococcaceae bacterium]|nr:beta-glucosidase [Oscillospiraceae bacterium]
MNNVEKIIEGMTPLQKLSEMTQLNGAFVSASDAEITGLAADFGLNRENIASIGTVLNFTDAKEMKRIQDTHLAESPNKLPLLFMMDVIHGYRTIYPIPLGLGASFDTELVKKCSALAAREATADGVQVTFTPMVDLVRDARWGRCMESTGEDTYLNCLMARAQIEGFSKGNPEPGRNLATCVKHYAAYGAAEAGRDYNTVDMSEHTLREYYLPAYRAAVDAGVDMVMTSFNLLNGVPAAVNKWTINDILRKEWGFDGVVITDYNSFRETVAHGYSKDTEHCARLAFETETDIEMMSPCFIKHGKKLLDTGVIDEERLNRSVRRILDLKEKVGMLDNPYGAADEALAAELFLSDEHRAVCRDAAVRSAVLLKNDGVLPLSEDIGKVAVIGPHAKSGMIGFWSCRGRADEAVSVYDGISAVLGEDRLVYAKGANGEVREKSDAVMIKEAADAASAADAAILCLGETAKMSGEGNSRVDISLTDAEVELIRAVSAVNKNTVVVLFNGRALALGNVIDDAPVFMTMWQPGTEGGSAAADLIFGRRDFTARLPVSFPYHSAQCPLYYNRMSTGRPKPKDDKHYMYKSNYIDYPNGPLFAFGHGLCYTEFEFSEPVLSSSVMHTGGTIEASVRIKNVGKREGSALPQLYIRDVVACPVRPVRELRGFSRVTLKPGEETTVSFEITEDMLAFHRPDGSFGADEGEFHVYISRDGESGSYAEFELVK